MIRINGVYPTRNNVRANCVVDDCQQRGPSAREGAVFCARRTGLIAGVLRVTEDSWLGSPRSLQLCGCDPIARIGPIVCLHGADGAAHITRSGARNDGGAVIMLQRTRIKRSAAGYQMKDCPQRNPCVMSLHA